VTGWPSGYVFGRVYAAGITDLAGPAAGLQAELGYGPDGSTPGIGWTFVSAPFNVDTDGGANDEYWSTLTATVAGTYDLAFRFSLDGGASWLPCDLDGNDGTAGGYDPAQAGTFVVEPPAGGIPDWCNLQFPPALTTTAGSAAGPIYGWLYEPGLTDAVGRGAGVIAEVGWGPDGSDPSMDNSGWSFNGAAYNVDTMCDAMTMACSNDEYQGSLLIPLGTSPGTYEYAVRLSLDGGASFLYCDLDGNDGAGNVYSPGQAGVLTVSP
jgi:hypothetical protein